MRPRLSRAFVHTFWDVFNNLGFWFAVNFFAFLSFFTVVLFPVALTGMLACQQNFIDESEVRFRTFWMHCRHYFKASFTLGLLYLVFAAVCGANLYFYWNHWGAIGKGMAAGMFFVLLFGKGMAFFAFPLIVLGNRMGVALRLSFFLMIKRFFFVLGALLIASLTFVVSALSVVLIPLLLFAITAVFWGNVFDQLRRSEEKREDRPLPDVTFKELFFPFQPPK